VAGLLYCVTVLKCLRETCTSVRLQLPSKCYKLLQKNLCYKCYRKFMRTYVVYKEYGIRINNINPTFPPPPPPPLLQASLHQRALIDQKTEQIHSPMRSKSEFRFQCSRVNASLVQRRWSWGTSSPNASRLPHYCPVALLLQPLALHPLFCSLKVQKPKIALDLKNPRPTKKQKTNKQKTHPYTYKDGYKDKIKSVESYSVQSR
jgi:hypothetical protein